MSSPNTLVRLCGYPISETRLGAAFAASARMRGKGLCRSSGLSSSSVPLVPIGRTWIKAAYPLQRSDSSNSPDSFCIAPLDSSVARRGQGQCRDRQSVHRRRDLERVLPAHREAPHPPAVHARPRARNAEGVTRPEVANVTDPNKAPAWIGGRFTFGPPWMSFWPTAHSSSLSAGGFDGVSCGARIDPHQPEQP